VTPALLLVFVALGVVVGFLAGLLGIGGASTMVPLLTLAFTSQRVAPEHVVHLAVGTSMAAIVFTSIASARAHDRLGAVLWPVFRGIAPGVVVGSLAGPLIVGSMPTRVLAAIFAVFSAISALQLLLGRAPKAHRALPGNAGLFGAGTVIGLVASMVGAGGAFLTVPFLESRNVTIHNAVATSAAVGMPIAAAGTIGFIVAGFRQPDLPPYSLGFVYLPALACIVAASVVLAPVGAKMAHRLPVRKLKRAFAFLLIAVAGLMMWKAVA
jgi:uncharacterized protein